MNKCDYNGALNTINLLREEYKKNSPHGIVKDIVYMEYNDSVYKVCMALVNSEGKAVTMEWPIDVWFTIPTELRNYAKEHRSQKIILDENYW
ncbi:hypothetical protein [uncultured Prevotella sp.]|uniref:hypothetical protein n=1 Tax=uncultured Prevotella sp. TaxID=159272 RepID=UPI00266D11F6|nr:hypothetical protein [uncultured Prevotella sp.]